MSDAINPDPRDLESRRNWLKLTTAAGGVAAVATAIPFVSTLAPSERAKAQGAAVEVDIADLAPGAMKTVEWRGKPVWVVRRTPEMIAALAGHDAELVDPQSLRDQQPAAQLVQQHGGDVGERRRVGHHRVADAGDLLDEGRDRLPGIDQHVEALDALAVNQDDADLGHPVTADVAAGGLQVDNGTRPLKQHAYP